MRSIADIDHEVEVRVEAMGFELVDIRWGGAHDGPPYACGSIARARRPGTA